jgi:hypothetical protein
MYLEIFHDFAKYLSFESGIKQHPNQSTVNDWRG